MKKTLHTIMFTATIAALVIALPTQAAVIDVVKEKVKAIKNDTNILKNSSRSMLGEVQFLSDMATVAGPLADTQIMGTIIDAVQPIVGMLQESKAEQDNFDAEIFRTNLGGAVQSIADMQMASRGQVSAGISKLQTTLGSANEFVLFSLSKTPLVKLIELTQGFTGELSSLVTITRGAIADIESSHTTEQVLRFTSLGMSAVAPAFVSCKFVLENVKERDITNLNLFNLRMKQISGVSEIALVILPKAQTVGVTAVGGATVSIPNPVIPMVVSIKEVADKFETETENWVEKHGSCEDGARMDRLDAFLVAEGY